MFNSTPVYLTIFLPVLLYAVSSDIPKFLERIPNVNVTAGREVSLPCVVDNIGVYKVAWTHINRQLLLAIGTNTVTLIPRFWVTREDSRTWTLHIKDVQPDDTGYYVCQVNMEPIINQVGFLQVVVPPTFLDDESTESHVEVQEGGDITLICKAKGVPDPFIKWTRENNRHLSGGRGTNNPGEKLILKSVTRQDMGAYLCIASNRVPPSISKRIVLEVTFSPVITVPNQLLGAPVGTSVTLECHVSAFPKAIHYWEFEGNLLMNSSRQETREIVDGYRTTLILRKLSLLPSDFGTYTCGSKNSHGETEDNLKLYEIKAPKRSEEKKSARDNNGDARGHIETLPPPWNKRDFEVGATTYTFSNEGFMDELPSDDFGFQSHHKSNTRKKGRGDFTDESSRTFGNFHVIPSSGSPSTSYSPVFILLLPYRYSLLFITSLHYFSSTFM